jgi:hypothetical protein
LRKSSFFRFESINTDKNSYEYVKKLMPWLMLLLWQITAKAQLKDSLPNTGISGVYEAMIATNDAAYHIRYFAEFGFTVVDSGQLSDSQAQKLYGVASALKSYRLQNGHTDAHGLIRLLVWEKPLGNGVGYSEPETIGSRMMVMKTKDIVRIADVFKMLRSEKQQKWLCTEPFFDDPLRINKNAETDFFKRPVGVRENAVYGELFAHVFFQRYGYEIPGYGTIADSTPLKTSELTHHDWFVQIDSMQQLMYLQNALGLKAEKAPEIDGDNLKGAKAVFLMRDGYSHWYQGFVSPNNICGKLKFFMPRGAKPNHSQNQRIGELGLTIHSFYTPKLNYIYTLLKRHGIKPMDIGLNELGERCFVFRGPEGASWQIIEKLNQPKTLPYTKVNFVFTKD